MTMHHPLLAPLRAGLGVLSTKIKNGIVSG